MCLTKVTHKYDPLLPETRVGYKVFFNKETTLCRLYRSEFYHEYYENYRWYKANATTVHYDINKRYTSGFHIFEDENIANNWKGNQMAYTVKKVEGRGIMVEGIQINGSCFVAKEMRIID